MCLHRAGEGTPWGYLDPSQSATCNVKMVFLSPEGYFWGKAMQYRSNPRYFLSVVSAALFFHLQMEKDTVNSFTYTALVLHPIHMQLKPGPWIPVSLLFCRAAGTGKRAEPAACRFPTALFSQPVGKLGIKYFIAFEPPQNKSDFQSDSLRTV